MHIYRIKTTYLALCQHWTFRGLYKRSPAQLCTQVYYYLPNRLQ